MGRYDGEDFSAKHYLQRQVDRQEEELAEAFELIREFLITPYQLIVKFKHLGEAEYGYFTWKEAINALQGYPHHKRKVVIRSMIRKHLIWENKIANRSLILSQKGEVLIEALEAADGDN